MRQKIAIFLPSLEAGGAERMSVILANAFARRGYAVDVLLARARGHFCRGLSNEITIHDMRAARTFGALPGLVRYLRRERPAALLATLSNANVVALLAARLSGVRTRVVIREACTLSTIEGEPALKTYVARLMRWTYSWADSIVVISDGVGDDLVSFLGVSRNRMKTIYNPAITRDFDARSREPVDHPWLAPGAPPLIVAVGRLTTQKDFPTLVRAFSRVRTRSQARLMIIGEGKDRVALEALVKSLGLQDQVDLLGFVDNPWRYMRAAAVFVMSSRWEGFGNVLVEAMACGVPVVSTDCPSGPREILEGGRWGALVPVGDSRALCAAILTQIESKPPRGMFDYVMKRFHEDAIVDRYLDVLVGRPTQ